MTDVWIDNAWMMGQGEAFTKTCPAYGTISWQGHAASIAHVGAAVASARVAFAGWQKTPLTERIAMMQAYAEALKARTEALAQAISKDMGKTLTEAKGEVGTMVGKIAVSIKAQAERAGTTQSEAAFGQLVLTHRPHGVMAVFGPFNFPGHLPNGHIIPALLAGNTCVFKPSELAPSVAVIMAEAFAAAGVPAGVVNIVQGGRAVGAALLDADVNGVLFTGSEKTGLFFHKYFAGRPEVMLALEMGGNNPLIIWEPESPQIAAKIAVDSAFLTTGQRCSCARRVMIPTGPQGDAIVDAIVEAAKGLKIGAWDEEGAYFGPLVSEQAAQAAVEFQMHLSKAGGKSLRRLKRMERGGGFVTAGIMDVTEAHRIPDEELFGPLMQIYRVDSLDAAITCANDTRFGLSAALVSTNPEAWDKVHNNVRAGILNLNRPTAGASGAMPFGGPGLSGNFRPGAYYAADYAAWPQASILG